MEIYMILSAAAIAVMLIVIMVVIAFKNKKAFFKEKNLLYSKISDLENENKILEIKLQENQKANFDIDSRLKDCVNQNKLIEQQKNQQISYLQNELRKSEKEVSDYKAAQDLRDAETDKKIIELNSATKSLSDERERVVAEEKRRIQELEDNRSRIWNDHENHVNSIMKDICMKGSYNFKTFDNNNRPDGFDEKFKPDFMLEFLNQYVIFDAKCSKSAKNLKNYISNQVKSTVKKIKESSSCDDIFRTIFLVIPTISINEIDTYSFYQDGYNVFVISVEAFEPILASFKKIESYDFADDFNPQEREDIVDLIAVFDNHIRQTSAVNILSSMKSLKVLAEENKLSEPMLEEIEAKRKLIKLDNFKPNDLKNLIKDPEHQIDELKKLVKPNDQLIKVSDIDI